MKFLDDVQKHGLPASFAYRIVPYPAETRVHKELDGEDMTRLNAQRLWMQYRDANCTVEREPYARGTAAPVV